MPPPNASCGELLHFDFGASVFQLLLDGRGFVFIHAFLNGFGRSFDEVLGFFQAEVGDCTNFFDHVDLVRAGIGQDDVEFGLLFCRGSSRSGCARGSLRPS